MQTIVSNEVLAKKQEKRYNSKAYQSTYYKNKRINNTEEVHKKDHIAYYKRTSTVDGRIKAMFSQAKVRAKNSGLIFDISLSDLYPLPDICPLLGIVIDYAVNGHRSEHSPSIDRIDNIIGYTKNNVCMVSWRANKIKNNATSAELRLIADNLDRIVAAKTKENEDGSKT